MRDIKFRAWDKQKREIFVPQRINTFLFNELSKYPDGSGKISSTDSILMQYTGLKDKNGKEVYEGDIVRLERHMGNSSQSYFTNEAVEWRGLQLYPFCLDHRVSCEVIGNIYSNPGLLEVKQ